MPDVDLNKLQDLVHTWSNGDCRIVRPDVDGKVLVNERQQNGQNIAKIVSVDELKHKFESRRNRYNLGTITILFFVLVSVAIVAILVLDPQNITWLKGIYGEFQSP